MSTTVQALTAPLPPLSLKSIRFALARLMLGSVGRLSRGIAIGHEFGFDSGVMLDHVYRNEARGVTALGRLIDRVYLDAPGWAGIRNRGDVLRARIGAEIVALDRPHVLLADLACGGGRYVLGALADLRDRGVAATAILRDYRDENVVAARAQAARLGVPVTVERADAFSDQDLGRLPRLDLAIVSGLHEIVADDVLVRNHFRQIAAILRPGGRLIVTVQPDHPQLEFIARVLTSHTGRPWAMRLRSVALLTAWAEAAGFSVVDLAMEPLGIFGVLTLRKA